MTSKIPCTVTVLTLNSGKTLRRCLESVKNCAEILVLDGNSTDDTLAIAREYGARVEKQYDTDEKNVRAKNFSELRIKSFGLAKNDWVFYVDSDEWLSSELWQNVARHVQENNPKKAGAFSRKAVIEGRPREYAFFYPEWCTRLWHKESGVYFKEGKVVHEQIFVPSGVQVTTFSGVLFAQWGDLAAMKRKNEFYLSLLASKVAMKRGLVSRPAYLRGAFQNGLRTMGIMVKIILTFLRHPNNNSVPLSYSWLFVRYHARIVRMWLRQIYDISRSSFKR